MIRTIIDNFVHRYLWRCCAIALLACSTSNVIAAESASTTTQSVQAVSSLPAGANTSTMLVVLVIALVFISGIIWLLKKSGLSNNFHGNAVAKIIGGVNVGTRELVMIIEIADQWIVIGVTPGRINTLATMPKQEYPTNATPAAAPNFSAWLKQTVDKRNDQDKHNHQS